MYPKAARLIAAARTLAVPMVLLCTVPALAAGQADVDGTTPLLQAVNSGDLTALDRLIAAHAPVDAPNLYGVTPLWLAASNGNAAAAERLLKAGADPNLARPTGDTPLMMAARAGNVDVVNALIAAGANVNARENTRGQTALMWAANQGNPGVIRALAAHGADLQARSHGPGEPAKRLPPGKRPYQRDLTRTSRVDAFTPLLFAVRAGRLDAVRTLIELGANVNDRMEDGTSALVLAAVNAHWDVGTLLADKGADPNAAEQGWSALHQVVRTRTLATGQFPLPVATGRISSMEFAKVLLAHGADVNQRMTADIRDGFRHKFPMKGATAFLLAAKGADWEMMRMLAAHGADPLAMNDAHTTPLMAAAGVDVIFFGEDNGTNEDGLEAVKIALELGGDVNAVNDDGETALHGAAGRGSNTMVQFLVDRGARVDVKNLRGFTPINVANGDGTASGSVRVFWPETVALLEQLRDKQQRESAAAAASAASPR
jgi:ankyrin repeat protein